MVGPRDWLLRPEPPHLDFGHNPLFTSLDTADRGLHKTKVLLPTRQEKAQEKAAVSETSEAC